MRKEKWQKIQALLADKNLSSAQIASQTGISQPTISRALKQLPVMQLGLGRASRFGWIEPESQTDIFRIDHAGEAQKCGQILLQPNQRLLLIRPDQPVEELAGLPYFLQDLVPRGFLAELALNEIQRLDSRVSLAAPGWTLQELLYFLTHFGGDLPGNLVFGKFMTESVLHAEPTIVREGDYGKVAQNLAGSDVVFKLLGGNQPKFSCFDGHEHLLVKFSPKLDALNPVAMRYKDLLVCEFLALQTLAQVGLDVSQAKLVHSDRLYLQLKRFDRVGVKGRRGVISLAAIEAHYIGKKQNWALTADSLHKLGMIDDSTRQKIHFLYAFGLLIGNNDMHLANLSFYFDGFKVESLAPLYDMLPMILMPKQGELPQPKWQAPPLLDVEPSIAVQAKELAKHFIKRVFENYLISYDTKKMFNS